MSDGPSNPEGPKQQSDPFEEALSEGFMDEREQASFHAKFSLPIHPDSITDDVKREFLVGVLRLGLSGVLHLERSEGKIMSNLTRILEAGKEAAYDR